VGVKILSDVATAYAMAEPGSLAVLYCSTTDRAFGPVFYGEGAYDAHERAEAFCRWLGPRDPRQMTDTELAAVYAEWRAQERAQWQREETEQNHVDVDDPPT
jgi:hypothetical protein